MISLVLIGIENPGNLGAIARVMKNFDQKNLVLIDPKCSPDDQDARNRAKHAQDILKSAKIEKSSCLKQFDYLIATTASLGTDYNVPRSPISPEEMAGKIAGFNKKGKSTPNIAILIGRESTGLTNEEIRMADFIVTIPTSKKYPTMNISHSVAILLYELSKASEEKNVSSHIQFAKKNEKDVIEKNMDEILASIEFATEEKRKTQRIIWKKVIAKSFLTRREAFAIIGFLKKIRDKVKK